jgi:hypothetical protein
MEEKYVQELLNRVFTYHAPTKEQIKILEKIRLDTRDFLKNILSVLSIEQPETKQFIKKIDEAVIWANSSVIRPVLKKE